MKYSVDKKNRTVQFMINIDAGNPEEVAYRGPDLSVKEGMDFTEARAFCKKILREIGYDSTKKPSIGKRYVGGKR